jgi:hypothetical protein
MCNRPATSVTFAPAPKQAEYEEFRQRVDEYSTTRGTRGARAGRTPSGRGAGRNKRLRQQPTITCTLAIATETKGSKLSYQTVSEPQEYAFDVAPTAPLAHTKLRQLFSIPDDVDTFLSKPNQYAKSIPLWTVLERGDRKAKELCDLPKTILLVLIQPDDHTIQISSGVHGYEVQRAR